MNTHLILHHCIADVVNQTPKFVRIPDVIEETLGLALFSQLGTCLTHVSKFPDHPHV